MRFYLIICCLLIMGCAVNNEVPTNAKPLCITCHDADTDPSHDILDEDGGIIVRGIGAHASHLNKSTISNAVACNECHIVPTEPTDPGHFDSTAPAEVTFGPLASLYTTPTWNGVSCSVYCHGNTEPEWRVVDGSQAYCGSCHSIPPPAPHPSFTNCSMCHGSVIDGDFNFIDKASHINGKIDVAISSSCNNCHQFTNTTPDITVPPPALENEHSQACATCHSKKNKVKHTGGRSCLTCHINLDMGEMVED